MSHLPRLLIIDDDYGRNFNSLREDVFSQKGIRDITNQFKGASVFVGEYKDYEVENPIAEAAFISGQKLIEDSYENDLDSTVNFIREGWNKYPRWSLILLDLCFYTGKKNFNGQIVGRDSDINPPNYFGLQILRQIALDESLLKIPIGILSSMDENPIVNEYADRLNVYFFQEKNKLNKTTLQNLIEEEGLIEDDNEIENNKIFGHSFELLNCLRLARKAAKVKNNNILLVGEPGTGKELFAKYIHRKAVEYGRKDIMETIHFSSIPETLHRTTMSGTKKGAYTGSIDFLGLKVANGGTIFFDEIGEVPKETIDAMYRLLEMDTREVTPAGSTESATLDVIIILATQRSEINPYMEDSFLGRIKTQIKLPSLRNRVDDIIPLAELFIKRFVNQVKTPNSSARDKELSEDVKQWLIEYDWHPRNISTLNTLMELCVINRKTIKLITLSDINENIKLIPSKQQLPKAPNANEKNSKPPITALLNVENQITIDNFEEVFFSNIQLKTNFNKILDSYKLLRLQKTIYFIKWFLEDYSPNIEPNFDGRMKLLFDDPKMKGTKAQQELARHIDLDSLTEVEKNAKAESTKKVINFLKTKVNIKKNK